MTEFMDAYELREQIGKGAFGAAFLVIHRETKKQFVLKKIRLARQTEWQRKSSFQEMAMMQSLRHPYIVPHIESWVDRGHTINIIYGYCQNGDLASLLTKAKAKKPFPEDQLKLWLAELLMALDYTHAKNVLHRDIKSSNIFITSEGDVQIGDFGLATFREGGEEDDQSLVGTPHYMSPELLSKRPYGFKSDIWSLGCVMYELTALRPAFTAFNIQGLVHKIKKSAVAPLPTTYSAEWCTVIRAMLRKRPEARPTVQELLASPCLRDALIEARDRGVKFIPDLELGPLPEPKAILPSRPVTPSRRGEGYDGDDYYDEGQYDSDNDEPEVRARARVPQSARNHPPSAPRPASEVDPRKRPMSARSPHQTPMAAARPMSAVPNKSPNVGAEKPPLVAPTPGSAAPAPVQRAGSGIRSLAPPAASSRASASMRGVNMLPPAHEADEEAEGRVSGSGASGSGARGRTELSSHHVNMSDDEDAPMASGASGSRRHAPAIAAAKDSHVMPSPGRIAQTDMGVGARDAARKPAPASKPVTPASPARPLTGTARPTSAKQPAGPTPAANRGGPASNSAAKDGGGASSGRPSLGSDTSKRSMLVGGDSKRGLDSGGSKRALMPSNSGAAAAAAAKAPASAAPSARAPASVPLTSSGPRSSVPVSESDSEVDVEEFEIQRERLQTLERALALCARLMVRGRVDELSYILHTLSGAPEPPLAAQPANADPSSLAGARMQSMLKTRSECPFQLGDQVIVGNRRRLKAVIRYYGPTAFGPGEWVGMELEKPEGKNDGTVNGIPYFQCPAGCGLFVKANILKPEAEEKPDPSAPM